MPHANCIISNTNLLNLQQKKLKYHIRLQKIKNNFSKKDLNRNILPVYDVEYKQKKPFQKISTKSNKYIFACFDAALQFAKDKKNTEAARPIKTDKSKSNLLRR